MRHAVCGMRQKRHISFLCEHDSFYPLCVTRCAVRQNESLHVAIHAANLYEFRCSTGVDSSGRDAVIS